jgi:hypothetical protein
MRTLIATWHATQDPAKDEPVKVRFDDGAPATMKDFKRFSTEGQQTDPDITYDQNGREKTVEFGYRLAA